jgi:transposase
LHPRVGAALHPVVSGVMWFNKDGHFDKSAKIEVRRCPMQKPKRRQYTAEFRHEAVRLIMEHGYGVTEAARSLGINTNMLGRWKRQSEQQRNGVARGNGHLSAEHDELVRLRQEVKRLRMEREILKQAALFFANESS